MAQEFTINSTAIESKINQLLPSQGGFGAGIDFSASTMVIPIVDLTETAEGSNVRQDLQTAYSYNNSTFTQIVNTTTDVVTTTGYYQMIGFVSTLPTGGGGAVVYLNDGVVQKTLWQMSLQSGVLIEIPKIIVKLDAGDVLQVNSGSSNVIIRITTRQIADINGNLTSA